MSKFKDSTFNSEPNVQSQDSYDDENKHDKLEEEEEKDEEADIHIEVISHWLGEQVINLFKRAEKLDKWHYTIPYRP